VWAINEQAFAIPWSLQQIAEDFNGNPNAHYLVALDENGAVAGYVSYWHVVNEGHINQIAVDGACQRQGVASLLLGAVEKEARTREMIGLTLEVRQGNRAAMGLYHKHGFKAEGYRKNYYADTKEDAVIMWKYF